MVDVRRAAVLQLNGLHRAGVEPFCHTQRSEVKRVRETRRTREVRRGTFGRVVNERRASVFQLHGLTVLERQRL